MSRRCIARSARPLRRLLIEGVQALQVSYGEDTDDDRVANVYRSADAVVNWNNVISVNLAMLIRSEESGTNTRPQAVHLLTPRSAEQCSALQRPPPAHGVHDHRRVAQSRAVNERMKMKTDCTCNIRPASAAPFSSSPDHAARDDRAGHRRDAGDAHGRAHGGQLARHQYRVPGCRGRLARRGKPMRVWSRARHLRGRALRHLPPGRAADRHAQRGRHLVGRQCPGIRRGRHPGNHRTTRDPLESSKTWASSPTA